MMPFFGVAVLRIDHFPCDGFSGLSMDCLERHGRIGLYGKGHDIEHGAVA